MLDHTTNGSILQMRAAQSPPLMRKLRSILARIGVAGLGRLLGAADGRTVAAMAARELSLILRSGEWSRSVLMWAVLCSGLLAIPLLFRAHTGQWQHPSGVEWFVLCGYTLQIGLFLFMAQWTIRRLRRDLYSDRLDELLLTRCSAADIAMGEALAAAIASLWLVAVAFPVSLFLAAMAGQGWASAVRLALSLAPAGGLGVWFGMGWGLAFALRRSAAIVPLTEWWFKGPLLPVIVAWAAGGFFTLVWLILSLIPGGSPLLLEVVTVCRWAALWVLWHANPLLTVGGAGGLWPTTWFTDWLVLLFVMLFMMRKSMDTVQGSLNTLPERDRARRNIDFWVHHDVHYFLQYGEGKRRQPRYYDGGNPIAAFDVALGHRVFLHPSLWAVGVLAYLFLLGWSLLVPPLGRGTGIVAVLLPATGALLLMSGGVAVSFGWERDQHRWPSLAVLPIDNVRLALGKIKGVVRPTLWIGFLASATALVLGWRGALPHESALWMALHVLVFPVALAFVSATLTLTTPTVGEALFRWAFLGALPTLGSILPPPIGGEGGLLLPLTPPLLVLLLVANGPTPELIRGAWISLGLEVAGVLGSLLILSLYLRRWTVGERD
jgi:hypothetical protein